jgi:L-iditol 2-dehydrogenase
VKACVLHGIGDLRYEEAPDPAPGQREVLVAVRACGVCGSDVPRVFAKGAYHFPTIPGHEFSGVVVAAGPGADAARVGTRVTVFPLIPCRACPACQVGAYAQCEDYDYLGSRSDGAFGEFVRVPEWNLARIPDGVSFEEAAMVEPAAVAAHALRQAGVDVGDCVQIFGAGPVGLLVGMWARLWGAGDVRLADIDARKTEFAQALGFIHTFNPDAGDPAGWARNATERGADVVVEASGSTAAFEQCMFAARPFGRVVLVGNPAGEMRLSPNAYWAILRKELKVCGSWNSCFGVLPKDEWRLALEFMACGRLDVRPLITHRVALERLPDALVMMRDRTEFHNKVMCVVDAE